MSAKETVAADAAHLEDSRQPSDDNVSLRPKEIDVNTTEGFADEKIQQETHHILDDEETRKAERKYLWKLDFLILPWISLAYLFQYLDRGNAANAKLYGLDKGHETSFAGVGPGTKSLTADQWEVIIMIFYVGLICFQVPGTIGYRVFPPSKWIAFGVCGFCTMSLLQNVAFNYAGLVVCRIFIGAFEGLFGTGIVYYFSLWYHKTELGVRLYWYLAPTALAGAFGGLIAYGVGNTHTSTPPWKWLFLIEGLPGFCLGLWCLYILPDRPLKNNKFRGKEAEIAAARYYVEGVDKADKIAWKHAWWAVSDWKLWMQILIYLPTQSLLSSVTGFLPSLIKELGYQKATTANLMTVPPYACAFVLMFIIAYNSDRFKERGLHVGVLMLIGAVAYLIIANLPETATSAKYGLYCISTACVYATYPIGHAWVSNNLGNETKRAIGLGLYTAISNTGGIAGSWFYPSTDAPEYRKGHYIAFAMALVAGLAAIANKLLLRGVNRHRDKKYGKPPPGLVIDVTENADNLPMFRFIT